MQTITEIPAEYFLSIFSSFSGHVSDFHIMCFIILIFELGRNCLAAKITHKLVFLPC